MKSPPGPDALDDVVEPEVVAHGDRRARERAHAEDLDVGQDLLEAEHHRAAEAAGTDQQVRPGQRPEQRAHRLLVAGLAPGTKASVPLPAPITGKPVVSAPSRCRPRSSRGGTCCSCSGRCAGPWPPAAAAAMNGVPGSAACARQSIASSLDSWREARVRQHAPRRRGPHHRHGQHGQRGCPSRAAPASCRCRPRSMTSGETGVMRNEYGRRRRTSSRPPKTMSSTSRTHGEQRRVEPRVLDVLAEGALQLDVVGDPVRAPAPSAAATAVHGRPVHGDVVDGVDEARRLEPVGVRAPGAARRSPRSTTCVASPDMHSAASPAFMRTPKPGRLAPRAKSRGARRSASSTSAGGKRTRRGRPRRRRAPASARTRRPAAVSTRTPTSASTSRLRSWICARSSSEST